jgi:hypothetical protein
MIARLHKAVPTGLGFVCRIRFYHKAVLIGLARFPWRDATRSLLHAAFIRNITRYSNILFFFQPHCDATAGFQVKYERLIGADIFLFHFDMRSGLYRGASIRIDVRREFRIAV